MNVQEFTRLLRDHPEHRLAFVLPDGAEVAAHYHVTEVGHLSKSFIDCGGTTHTDGACLLQLWVADDTEHRLRAGKLLAIFERAAEVLPSMDLPVEIEHEAPVLTQLPLTRAEAGDGVLRFHTRWKKTDCLAKELCLPDFSLPAIPGQAATCIPGGGCC